MISTPEEFFLLCTVKNNRNFGKFDEDMTPAFIMDAMNNSVDMDFIGDIKEMMAKIKDTIDPKTLEKTNVEMHFAIRPESMVQYVTPYEKDYSVGKTVNGVKEQIIWAARPEYIHAGHHLEVYSTNNEKRHLIDKNEHVFGHVDEYMNALVLHTHEYQGVEDGSEWWSTLHVVVFIPVGDTFFGEISKYAQEKAKAEHIERTEKLKRRTPRRLRRMQARLDRKARPHRQS